MEKFNSLSSKSFLILLIITFVAAAGFAQAATEKTSNPIADVYYDSSAVVWVPKVEKYDALLLTVFGPQGVSFEQTFYPGEKPVFELIDNCGAYFPDGSCVYELRLIPYVSEQVQEILEKRRFDVCTPLSEEALALQTATVQSGAFTIKRTQIVLDTGGDPDIPDGDAAEGQLKSNDIGHLNDVYITGSLCLGFDCVDGTSFGYDTQIFKEHNLRIYFQDTSYAASYPTNDWRIVINDSANGGGAYFSVFDAGSDGNSSTQVFTLEGGAPANSLYVDDYGRVGFGTSTPVVELHTVDGDTPTLRLQQDASSGWTAQTWDVAGNESNFFVRDATNGSKLPFRIQPGTPSSTLSLKSTGYVGIGTWSPSGPLHVETSGGDDFLVTSDGNVGIGTTSPHAGLDVRDHISILENSGLSWKATDGTIRGNIFTDPSDNIYIRNGSSATTRITIDSSGNVGIGTTSPAGKLDVNGSIYQRGGVLHADYVFEPGYKLESIEEHADFMYENKHLKAVPKAKADENGIEIVEVGSHRRGILEELEKAHIYIHQLSTQNKKLEERLAMLETIITEKYSKPSLSATETK